MANNPFFKKVKIPVGSQIKEVRILNDKAVILFGEIIKKRKKNERTR